MNTTTELILASASPRRAALLDQIGIGFTQRAASIDESVLANEQARSYVARLAKEKAEAVGRQLFERQAAATTPVILAADTIVAANGELLGKPRDANHAKRMLTMLSNSTHHVLTGVAVCTKDHLSNFVVETEVCFRPLSSSEIDAYVVTGEPTDKAGAYAIQGAGGAFVEAINGSYSNVVGLPLAETLVALRSFGVQSRLLD